MGSGGLGCVASGGDPDVLVRFRASSVNMADVAVAALYNLRGVQLVTLSVEPNRGIAELTSLIATHHARGKLANTI
jgi:hypothetical protein